MEIIDKYFSKIAKTLGVDEQQVVNTVKLLEEGATVPFISRYRKEMTGSLDEVQILDVKELYAKFLELDKRRDAILKSVDEQEKLTPALKALFEAAETLTALEDLYLPYKPKRKTRASIAREKGLEGLARILLQQKEFNIEKRAEEFLNDQVSNVDEALQGARDIIAEWVNENLKARDSIRRLFDRDAVIYSRIIKGKEPDGIKYGDYYDFNEPLRRCPSHRYLAMLRGVDEGFLKMAIEPNEEKALQILEEIYIKGSYDVSEQVKLAVHDAYKRLLQPSLETEYRNVFKEKADIEAIRVFADNLRQLLLAAPLGQKNVLALDPGFRSGCKLVCLDSQGNLIHNETIYPHAPQNESKQASKKLVSLVNAYKIDAIAIGNGTASRETEALIRNTAFDRDIKVFVVSESGASIYSASPIAREEFPDYDVTVRGSVSIGRRLMDPLAELVKIDPKSIGVGQYQHDVDQSKLKSGLDSVVESCVNLVGVNVNTASKHILTYISGLGPTLAQNIVNYRKENGDFHTREELKKVPRMGDKAFEQSAGFLRISNSDNPLDNSAVHPESYAVVNKMAANLNCKVEDLIKNVEIRQKIDIERYISAKTGLPTLQDILKELAKPGRDPRSTIKVFEFDPNVRTMDDLQVGMELPGIVTNITNFGAFVDVGVKQDGLVHLSQMADRFIKDPNEVVKLHQHVRVRVTEVDKMRKRIQLSMKGMGSR